METPNRINIVRMRESHLNDVFEIAQKNKLSYWSPEDYRTEIRRTDSCCIVAENHCGITAGFLTARLIIAENCTELYNIAVDDFYKRNKIGQKLLVFLTNHSISNNLARIILEVRESNNNAILFYLKQNFRQAGVRKDFYTQPAENALTMIKFLPAK